MNNSHNSTTYMYNPFPADFNKIYSFNLSYINKYLFQGITILDLGCGSGCILEGFETALIKEYVGIDIDNKHIAAAKSKYAKEKNINFIHSDIEDLNKLKLAEYDLIIFRNSFHHIKEKKHTLNMIYEKYLKPSGCMLIIDIDARSNYSCGGIGLIINLLFFSSITSFKDKLILLKCILVDTNIKIHRRQDKIMLKSQLFYSWKQIKTFYKNTFNNYELFRINSYLYWGGCYLFCKIKGRGNE